MRIDDPIIVSLRAEVKAAQEEFDLALTFHEIWKPAAYDEQLRERMGVSYATNAFHVVRVALRRETLLALLRLWDKRRESVRMDSIARTLRNKDVIAALATDRVTRMGLPEAVDQMTIDMTQRAVEAADLIGYYSKDGRGHSILEKLKKLRHKRLAHREFDAIAVAPTSPTDGEIETFFQDNAKLVQILLSLVVAVGYDPKDAAEVYQHYAKLFWSSVRGERTPGHPNYRKPLNSTEQ